MPPDFISHLDELRRRLLLSLVSFVCCFAIAYFFSGNILEILIQPLHQYREVRLVFQKPYEAFLAHLTLAAYVGLVLSLPVFLAQVWAFVSPGLYQREKRIWTALIPAAVLCFALGAAVAYTLVIPWALFFLLGFQTEHLQPYLTVGAYLSFVVGLMVAFGTAFEFPVIILGLVKWGVLGTPSLIRARKWVIVSIFLLAAVLTPPDPASQVMLALPLAALFEVSVFLARMIERRRNVSILK